MKKKLLFVIDSLNCGGAEKSLVSLLQMIDFSRYEVDLILFARGGVFEKYVPDEVKICYYKEETLFPKTLMGQFKRYCSNLILSPQHRLNKKRNGAEIYWRTMHRLFKTLKKDYDVAVAYSQGTPSFFVSSKVVAKKKMTWINTDIFAAGFDMGYCRGYYETFDHIVAVSEVLYDKLSSEAPWMRNKLSCIYDIVNQGLIRQMASEHVNDLPVTNDDEVTMVTVGRLATPKNYPLAVDTAQVLKQRGVKFKWLFVGEGECRASIEKKITDYGLQQEVFLLGLKENPYPYMSRADVYVQTSSYEGFGLTIAEAKILHIPVVSTDFDVVYNQIQDRQNGLIVSMTPESVADGIMELINNVSLRDSIIENLKNENNSTSKTEIRKFYQLIDN